EIATPSTAPSWPRRQRNCSPVSASHTRTVLSLDAPTIRRPSAEIATLITQCPPLLCQFRQRNSFPVSASHTRTVLSLDPPTIRRPSAEIATLHTQPSCPRRQRSSAPLSASHTRTVLS